MSVATSPATGRPYGLRRVCACWGVPRSTFYAHDPAAPTATSAGKRGPRTRLTDEQLLVHIREDLAASLFQGEGHRKVWARLRVQRDIRVSLKRVLRIMRENHLLSPNRVPQGEPETHDGRITTDAPNVMWGIDGARILTLDDGWVWAFPVVDHWNAQCMGWQVCKPGSAFEAAQALGMALSAEYGSVGRDAARGVLLRMDHGCQFTSDHFQQQIRFWGIGASFAFVAQPETNGVAERFIRTLKEQAIYGRQFRNIEEVRVAIRTFVTHYNASWLVEKRGYLSPAQARAQWRLVEAA
ncbi:MAG: IS3 family transposase [Dehalococcoidia bacterium]|nr:MAG: IS3 family transposase [Dehalococcoidia bacterium]